MALLPNRNCALLGFQVQGDLGGYTSYTDQRGQVVWFAKAPPLNPPSLYQQWQQKQFTQAMSAWHGLDQSERDAWRRAATRTHSRMTPTNLFIHYFLFPCDRAFERLQRAGREVLNKVRTCGAPQPYA